jgi:translocation protein SEC62
MQSILSLGLILKVQKEECCGKKNELKEIQDKTFTPEDLYVWIYQGGQMRGMLMGVGVLLVIFIGVLFPLWPPFMRQGSYYLSLAMMGFLGFLMFLGVVRAILWLGLVLVTGRGGWLFPNLFADMGVIESFFPFWRYPILI